MAEVSVRHPFAYFFRDGAPAQVNRHAFEKFELGIQNSMGQQAALIPAAAVCGPLRDVFSGEEKKELHPYRDFRFDRQVNCVCDIRNRDLRCK